jgi:HD superfamily phosphohydrolase
MTHHHAEFLTDADIATNRVRCPVHGFIRFSENERAVIDHRLFRRLRYIRQLALTELIYPGASHTRFEHSLGVMELATRAFDALAAKHGDLLEYTFSKVDGLNDRSLAKARQALRLAALLHDVGHSSFSHAAEDVVHKGSGHEELSVKIIRQSELMGGLLTERYDDIVVNVAALLVEGGETLPPQLSVLHDIISGQMDADRSDYLLRDSLHCGVDYGRFDYRRLIECFEVVEGEMGDLQIALHRDGIHTLEALILARYQMNTQVYYHRVRRIYDYYLLKYHEELAADEPFTETSILANNDVTLLNRIMMDAADPDLGARCKWAKLIADRSHHRVIYDTSVNANADDIRRAKRTIKLLESSRPDFEYTRRSQSAEYPQTFKGRRPIRRKMGSSDVSSIERPPHTGRL